VVTGIEHGGTGGWTVGTHRSVFTVRSGVLCLRAGGKHGWSAEVCGLVHDFFEYQRFGDHIVGILRKAGAVIKDAYPISSPGFAIL